MIPVPGHVSTFGWFSRIHAVLSRGYSGTHKAKAVKNGGAVMELRYGTLCRCIYNDEQSPYSYTVGFHMLSFNVARCWVILNPEKQMVKEISEENMAYLLGFYEHKYDADTQDIVYENGKPVTIFNVPDMMAYLRKVAKPYTVYTLVYFLTEDEKKVMRDLGFIW